MNERRLFVLGRLARRQVRLLAAIERLDRVTARLGREDRSTFSSLTLLHWLLRQLRREPEPVRRMR